MIIGNARLLARNPLWNALLVHFQERDCLVEGSLTNLQLSMISLPRPKMSSTDKRLNFTALGGHGGEGVAGPMEAPNLYFGRQWGEHPDMRSFDGRSQASSSVALSSRRADSRFDPRYQHQFPDAASVDGSIQSQ